MAEISEHFLIEGKHRTFRIVAGGFTFYVIGHFLAEISSFFDAAFFGDFAEAREKVVTLQTDSAEDVAVFLEVVHPGERKKITERNCAIMMRYSDIWDISSLRTECTDYLHS
ncbi:hypothetical protein KIN20_020507 [Parelaphostrongylus tenuis]|uniref:BTB domain-containing protein n=1 Tax=Parelaphostrongylus tenuis TaxID=148309 RepID=A0AAD5QLZ9_PARTN|nr:hypothetical protein KIN20_010714 [Parelaphostrongylus tenuis]KAJ1361291.1 hypothetical protein KIN20_020507 [Parelaphostrongylus tenuis]